MMKGGRGFDVLLLLYKTTTYPKTQRRGVGEYGIRPKLIKYVFYSILFYSIFYYWNRMNLMYFVVHYV
jgi:hypothetical protein